jgi:hypothetical protein
VIALPPLLAGAAKDTEICALPAVAVTPVGGSGAVAGVTLFEGADGGPFPSTFVAATVKVYAVPLVKPVTVRGLLGPEAVSPPGDDVAVYPVIGLPPLLAGAVNDTTACALPATAAGLFGALGTAIGVTLLVGVEGTLFPRAFVATTVNVYAVPLTRPATVNGLATPDDVTPPGLDVTV